jgi:hypothetical protein
MCIEVIRANAGSRYGRRTIEFNREAGFVTPISPVDPIYSGLWMGRTCPECVCSPETCLTLQDLGMSCETHQKEI